MKKQPHVAKTQLRKAVWILQTQSFGRLFAEDAASSPWDRLLGLLFVTGRRVLKGGFVIGMIFVFLTAVIDMVLRETGHLVAPDWTPAAILGAVAAVFLGLEIVFPSSPLRELMLRASLHRFQQRRGALAFQVLARLYPFARKRTAMDLTEGDEGWSFSTTLPGSLSLRCLFVEEPGGSVEMTALWTFQKGEKPVILPGFSSAGVPLNVRYKVHEGKHEIVLRHRVPAPHPMALAEWKELGAEWGELLRSITVRAGARWIETHKRSARKGVRWVRGGTSPDDPGAWDVVSHRSALRIGTEVHLPVKDAERVRRDSWAGFYLGVVTIPLFFLSVWGCVAAGQVGENISFMGRLWGNMMFVLYGFSALRFLERFPLPPRWRLREAHRPQEPQLRLFRGSLFCDRSMNRIVLDRPFQVSLFRDDEEGGSRVTVQLSQEQGGSAVRVDFAVPSDPGEDYLSIPRLAAREMPEVSAEDFQAWIWPALVSYGSAHGVFLPWSVSGAEVERSSGPPEGQKEVETSPSKSYHNQNMKVEA